MNDSIELSESQKVLTQEQVNRAEKNRKRALEIRQQKEESSNKMYTLIFLSF
jgi:hypothetical protein